MRPFNLFLILLSLEYLEGSEIQLHNLLNTFHPLVCRLLIMHDGLVSENLGNTGGLLLTIFNLGKKRKKRVTHQKPF